MFEEILAEEIDANSPVTTGLMNKIKSSLDYFDDEAILRDGTVLMLGTLGWDYTSTEVVAIDTAGKIIMTGGGDIDTEGGDLDTGAGGITCTDLEVLGVLTADLLATSYAKLSMKGATETAAAGVLKDSANSLDFLAHLTNVKHFAWVPDLLSYGCTFVETVTDADNLVMSDSTEGSDQNSRDYGNGLDYLLVGLPIDSDLLMIHSSSGASTPRTISIDDDHGGLKRSWVIGKLVSKTGGNLVIAAYGGDTLTVWPNQPGGPSNAYFMFAIKQGTNDLVVTYGGAMSSAVLEIYVDHSLRPVQSSI